MNRIRLNGFIDKNSQNLGYQASKCRFELQVPLLFNSLFLNYAMPQNPR